MSSATNQWLNQPYVLVRTQYLGILFSLELFFPPNGAYQEQFEAGDGYPIDARRNPRLEFKQGGKQTKALNCGAYIDPNLIQANEEKPKRKVPGLEDPYEHAPPKPDGDLWAILLKPELEADKMRCDAWKEEVQNLLIFVCLSLIRITVVGAYLC